MTIKISQDKALPVASLKIYEYIKVFYTSSKTRQSVRRDQKHYSLTAIFGLRNNKPSSEKAITAAAPITLSQRNETISNS